MPSLSRRFGAAVVVTLLLAAVPTISTASPEATLPQRSFNQPLDLLPPLPLPDQLATLPGLAIAATATPRDRTTLAGSAWYADPCETPGDEGFDIRRMEIGLDTTTGQVLFFLRVCLEGPALTSWDGRSIEIHTRTNGPPSTRRIRVTFDGAEHVAEVYAQDEQTPFATAQARVVAGDPLPVPELEVQVDADVLAFDGCDPQVTADPCAQFAVASFFAGEDTPRDQLPDFGIVQNTPLWPDQCAPALDPEDTGHAMVSTDSPAAARRVADRLAAAGYVAALGADPSQVEVRVGVTDRVRRVLSTWSDVDAVAPVGGRTRLEVQPDDPRLDEQWYLPRLRVPTAWETTTGSASVGIAVVDDGVAASRPELTGRVQAGFDALTGTVIPPGQDSDTGGHGSAVAGLLGSLGDDGQGMAGVDWAAAIHPVRVFDHGGCFVLEQQYLTALDWVAQQAAAGNVQVANFSLGGGAIEGEAEGMRDIVDNGAVVIAAMGNESDATGAAPSFPAALPEVVAVGATGPDDGLAGYSNGGRHVDVVAPGGVLDGSPGGGILTLADPTVVGGTYDDAYEAISGTSFSSPLVAGIAALYRAAHPTATPADVVRALLSTTEDLGLGLAGFDITFGYGLVDASRALAHEPGQTTVRLEGGDRYETAALTSRRAFTQPDLVDVVLLATGQNYPDALAGGPLAARQHAPLLLTPGDRLHPATIEELERLRPARVLLLGGESVLSPDIVVDLQERGFEVDRAAGPDRYKTAATIALGPGSWRAWNTSDVVYVATGTNFPDALPGGAAAAAVDAPLLLTDPAALPPVTAEALVRLDPSLVVVLGGPAAVSDAVVDQIRTLPNAPFVERAAGQDRFETAVAALCPLDVLCQYDARYVVVTTGEGFADALGGSAAAAALRAPLLLVPGSGSIPASVQAAMDLLEPEQAVVLGGPVAVADEVRDAIGRLVVQ